MGGKQEGLTSEHKGKHVRVVTKKHNSMARYVFETTWQKLLSMKATVTMDLSFSPCLTLCRPHVEIAWFYGWIARIICRRRQLYPSPYESWNTRKPLDTPLLYNTLQHSRGSFGCGCVQRGSGGTDAAYDALSLLL